MKTDRMSALAEILIFRIIPYNREHFLLEPKTMRFPSFGLSDYVVENPHSILRMRPPLTYRNICRWFDDNKEELSCKDCIVAGWNDPRTDEYALEIKRVFKGFESAGRYAMTIGIETVFHPMTSKSYKINNRRAA